MYSSGEEDDLESYLRETRTSGGSRNKDIDWSKLMNSTELNYNHIELDNNLLDEQVDMFLKKPEDKKTSQPTPTRKSSAPGLLQTVSELVESPSQYSSDPSTSGASYTLPSDHSEVRHNLRNISDLSDTPDNSALTQDNDYTPAVSEASSTSLYQQNPVYSIDQLETLSDPSLPTTPLSVSTSTSEPPASPELSIAEEYTEVSSTQETREHSSTPETREHSSTPETREHTGASVEDHELSLDEEYVYSDQFSVSTASGNTVRSIVSSGNTASVSSGNTARMSSARVSSEDSPDNSEYTHSPPAVVPGPRSHQQPSTGLTQDASVQTTPPHLTSDPWRPSTLLPCVLSPEELAALSTRSPASVALTDLVHSQLALIRLSMVNTGEQLDSVYQSTQSGHTYTTLEGTQAYINQHRPRILSMREAKYGTKRARNKHKHKL